MMKNKMYRLVSMLLLIATLQASAQNPDIISDTVSIQHISKARSYRLVFEDDFNRSGKPDASHWLYRDNAKMGGISWPGNVEQKKSPDGSHALHINFTYEPKLQEGQQYRGGGIVSIHNFGYGYYEAKVKLYGGDPELSGLHQSFWSMGLTGTNEAEGKGVRDSLVSLDIIPGENRVLEIDCFEQDSKGNSLGLNYHIYSPTHKSKAPVPNHITKDLSKWIVMAYEWLPDRINFYSDGKFIATKMLEGPWKLYAPQNLWLTALPVNMAAWGGLKVPGKDASMRVDYFKFYAKDLAGINRIGNADFEYGATGNTYPIAWITSRSSGNDKDAGKVVTDQSKAQTGVRYLIHQSEKDYKAVTKQLLEYIPNGVYNFSAWVKSSGGQKQASIVIRTGKSEQVIPVKANSEWTKVALKDVKVMNNQAFIEIHSNAKGGQWLMADNFEFKQ